MKIQIDGKCDKTRYPIALTPNQRVTAVEFRDLTLPRIKSRNGGYYIAPNAKLTAVGNPPDLTPDSPVAAYWYCRACYENKKLPMFYHYKPSDQLVVFPAPNNDGDRIIITVEDIEPESA